MAAIAELLRLRTPLKFASLCFSEVRLLANGMQTYNLASKKMTAAKPPAIPGAIPKPAKIVARPSPPFQPQLGALAPLYRMLVWIGSLGLCSPSRNTDTSESRYDRVGSRNREGSPCREGEPEGRSDQRRKESKHLDTGVILEDAQRLCWQ